VSSSSGPDDGNQLVDSAAPSRVAAGSALRVALGMAVIMGAWIGAAM